MENKFINQKIDTSAEDFAKEAERKKFEREMLERQKILTQPIDTSAEDFAREAERLKAQREYERGQQMLYQDIDKNNMYSETKGRRR